MPFRDDLIERTIEQLAQILSRLVVQNDPASAEGFIREAYRKHTGTDGLLFRQLPSSEVIQTLSTTGTLDKEKSYLIAALLESQAHLAELQHQAPATALQLKALDLYLETALADIGAEDIHERIQRVRQGLEAFVLPEATEWRLFRYETMQGDFAGAENRLFGLLETAGASDEVKHQGRAFYETLKQRSDEDLEAGGLPRAEIDEGEATFEALLEGYS